MASDPRHPLLADTSSLIAVANTDQWDVLAESFALTTTNVCKHELQNHVTSNTYAPEGSREQYLKRGSQRVLEHVEDESSSWSCVTVVPRPHGPDAGEESLKQELSEHGDSYQVVSLLDGRRDDTRHGGRGMRRSPTVRNRPVGNVIPDLVDPHRQSLVSGRLVVPAGIDSS